MPLPMMALLRLNTDIPNDVLPSNCSTGVSGGSAGEGRLRPPHGPLASLATQSGSVWCPGSPSFPGCPAHISEVRLLAGAFLQEALALHTALARALDPVGTGKDGSSASAPTRATPLLAPCPTHLWPPALGGVTGSGPSACLPLGTSSTISVCRGASMARAARTLALPPTVRGLQRGQALWCLCSPGKSVAVACPQVTQHTRARRLHALPP